MATSRLRTRSLARHVLMTPVPVGSSGPTCSIGRYRAGRPTVVDVIDAPDPPVPGRGPAAGCPGPDVTFRRVTSAAAEPGPDPSQGFPEFRNAGDHGPCECRGADHYGTDQHRDERACRRRADHRSHGADRQLAEDPVDEGRDRYASDLAQGLPAAQRP